MTDRKKGPRLGLGPVRSVIAGLALAGTISLEETARQLGTSARTLQRRLHAQGTSFWALVEQSRFEIAAALLRRTDLPVHEIATRIGYSTPSGFARAFLHWAGQSPSAYRMAPQAHDPHGVEWREMGRKTRRGGIACENISGRSKGI